MLRCCGVELRARHCLHLLVQCCASRFRWPVCRWLRATKSRIMGARMHLLSASAPAPLLACPRRTRSPRPPRPASALPPAHRPCPPLFIQAVCLSHVIWVSPTVEDYMRPFLGRPPRSRLQHLVRRGRGICRRRVVAQVGEVGVPNQGHAVGEEHLAIRAGAEHRLRPGGQHCLFRDRMCRGRRQVSGGWWPGEGARPIQGRERRIKRQGGGVGGGQTGGVATASGGGVVSAHGRCGW
eukprot:scaffold4752_cov97-Isochrysis_galbana.AAC.2